MCKIFEEEQISTFLLDELTTMDNVTEVRRGGEKPRTDTSAYSWNSAVSLYVVQAADQSAQSDASKTASVSAASTPSTAATNPSPMRRLSGELLDIGDEVLQERGEANGVMVLAVAYPLVLHRLCAEIAKTTAPEELIHGMYTNIDCTCRWNG